MDIFRRDFVQFVQNGDVGEGEVVSVHRGSVAVRVWEDGEPTDEVVAVVWGQVRLHPDGRR